MNLHAFCNNGIKKTFHHKRSEEKDFDAATDVMARRSSWSRVTETDELMGVLNSLLALPQYLMQAIFVGLVTVSTKIWAIFETYSSEFKKDLYYGTVIRKLSVASAIFSYRV